MMLRDNYIPKARDAFYRFFEIFLKEEAYEMEEKQKSPCTVLIRTGTFTY